MRETSVMRAVSAVLLCVMCHAAVMPAVGAAEPSTDPATPMRPLFRIDRVPVDGGAELLTVFGALDAGLGQSGSHTAVPLVSVLRDTLGDTETDNDRLRSVWVHGFTRPSAGQRVASAVPFLNRRAGNKDPESVDSLPPSLIDLAAPTRDIWKTVMWMAAQSLFFDPYGALAKSSVRAFRRNGDDYRKVHIIRALAVLSLYEAESGDAPVLSPVEMRDVQARLLLAQQSFGGIVNDAYLQRAYERQASSSLDERGHNWELLRQRSEAEGLYFEPLTMPDGGASHALLWVARQDVDGPRRVFDKRFLNIASPWRDARLRSWNGYSETRYFDADGRRVQAGTPGAAAVELIPLALYGLDHPKIPALLVDFRDRDNPKRREVSRRIVNDVTRNVLSLSPYGDLHYFLGRSVYNFVTGRRGMDINQPSRLRSYSLLRLLLSLNSSLDPDFVSETSRLLERVSMNPLQNDRAVEEALAQRSYAALLAAANAPSGQIGKQLARDRRAEFARLEHGRTARVLLGTASVVSLGIYRHRENDATESQLARIDVSRRLAYHRRFLEEVLDSTPLVDVGFRSDDVRRAMAFIAEHGSPSDGRSATLAARIFERTDDPELRRLCLNCLSRATSRSAREALARLTGTPGAPGEGSVAARSLEATAAPAPSLTVTPAAAQPSGD